MTVNEYGRLDQDNPTIGERLEQLETIVEKLELRIFQLEMGQAPLGPQPVQAPSNKCPNCALEWDGVMGYVCNRTDCPYGGSTCYSDISGINTGG